MGAESRTFVKIMDRCRAKYFCSSKKALNSDQSRIREIVERFSSTFCHARIGLDPFAGYGVHVYLLDREGPIAS